MNIIILLTSIISIVVFIIIEGMIGISILLRNMLKKKKNYIDIVIIEFDKNGLGLRTEIGRRVVDKDTGYKLVTAGFLAGSIKDDLGHKVTEKDFYPSLKGVRRKACIVGIKDRIPAPIDLIMDKLNDDEKTLVQNLCAKKVLPIGFDEIPQSLALSPVPYEAENFIIETTNDVQKIYERKLQTLGKTLIWVGCIIFIVLIITGAIVFSVVISKSGEVSNQLAAQAPTFIYQTASNMTMPPFG